MDQPLSGHHKRNKNIISNKKAFSSIVGAIFAVLVIVSLTGTFFVWSLQQNSRYVEAVSGVNDLVLYQKSESINVTSVPIYTVGAGGNVLVSVGLQNDGPISVTIKTLWLQDLNRQAHGKTQLNPTIYTLSPGESQPIGETVVVSDAVAGDLFYGWLTTARGTTVQLYPSHQTGPQGEPGTDGTNGTNSYDARTALISQGIGSIAMNFKSFRTYVVNSSNHLGIANPAYTFSRSQNVAFSVNVTNMDPDGGFLNLTSRSCLWIFSPSSGAIKGEVWLLANMNNNIITPLASNQFILLNYNETKTLYFGPFQCGGSNIGAGITGVNLIVTGKVGVSDYGQNLPFISLIAT